MRLLLLWAAEPRGRQSHPLLFNWKHTKDEAEADSCDRNQQQQTDPLQFQLNSDSVPAVCLPRTGWRAVAVNHRTVTWRQPQQHGTDRQRNRLALYTLQDACRMPVQTWHLLSQNHSFITSLSTAIKRVKKKNIFLTLFHLFKNSIMGSKWLFYTICIQISEL